MIDLAINWCCAWNFPILTGSKIRETELYLYLFSAKKSMPNFVNWERGVWEVVIYSGFRNCFTRVSSTFPKVTWSTLAAFTRVWLTCRKCSGMYHVPHLNYGAPQALLEEREWETKISVRIMGHCSSRYILLLVLSPDIKFLWCDWYIINFRFHKTTTIICVKESNLILTRESGTPWHK